jgi:hypothetical protein
MAVTYRRAIAAGVLPTRTRRVRAANGDTVAMAAPSFVASTQRNPS